MPGRRKEAADDRQRCADDRRVRRTVQMCWIGGRSRSTSAGSWPCAIRRPTSRPRSSKIEPIACFIVSCVPSKPSPVAQGTRICTLDAESASASDADRRHTRSSRSAYRAPRRPSRRCRGRWEVRREEPRVDATHGWNQVDDGCEADIAAISSSSCGSVRVRVLRGCGRHQRKAM